MKMSYTQTTKLCISFKACNMECHTFNYSLMLYIKSIIKTTKPTDEKAQRKKNEYCVILKQK